MEKLAAHPSRDELSAYSLGQLPEERAVAIDNHISQCEPCCETIVGLASEDTFAGLLRETGRLPTDLTADQDSVSSESSSNPNDVPPPLAEHPRYEVLCLIGKGGMGDVYKARHRKMERTVALKVINRGLVRKAEAIDRFHREVKAAAQLSHPNIVTSHDADQAGGYHFMVMEFVDGVDLSQTVKDRGALPVAEACDYVRQAAIGLQHAHHRGMVHRDIKPHNLMVTKDGKVKILDFGLASFAPEAIADADTNEARGDLTMAGAIMGTPDFISPEQADDARTADIRSDIYSLGATLYFLLSAQPPFAEGSVMHKLKSHAQSDPEPLSTVRLDVPAALADVIKKMMAKDPDERFQTPEDLAESLKPFSQSAEPRGIVEPATQTERRRWKPTTLLLTAVAVLFVAAFFAGITYFLQTDHGVVRVEVTDPSLAVTINDQTITMKDKDGKVLTIRPGKQTLIVRKDGGDMEFETDRFQVRRGDEVAFKVEILQGEIVVRKDGERFHSEAMSDDIDARRIVDRMVKAYAECKTYRDSGVIKSRFKNTVSPAFTVEYSFTTAYVRPDRFRFEIKDDDANSLLIAANGQNIQTWWDVEPGIQNPESVEIAMAQALGFTGGDVGRIPAMLMPQELAGLADLEIIAPKQIGDGMLQDVECFRLEYNFRDEQFILWIDKQSHLVRQIDERIEADGVTIERTTTFDPTIDGKITDEMLEFDPPSPSAVDDGADLLPPDKELKLLQGNWEAVSVIEGGKQLIAEEGFGGLLLQIEGSTFAVTETKSDGAKSEPDTGLIEFSSTSAPKTIDLIDRDQSDKRSIGIYQLKDGILRICMVETGEYDSPPGKRISEVKPAKRPTTFESPTGSNILLMEFERKQPNANSKLKTRNPFDTTYISNDTVGLLVAHPQRIFRSNSKVHQELDQRFANIAESEGLDVRNLRQILLQLGPPPLSSRPVENFFDEQILTVILRFDDPIDIESYIEKHSEGYTKATHKHGTYYKHDNRMEMWFPDNRTLILAAERRILSFIDGSEGKGPMATRMRRTDASADLLLEMNVRQVGPLLLEWLPSEATAPEVYPVIEQTIQQLKHITLTARQSSDSPILATFQAIDGEKAKDLGAQASLLLETTKRGWPTLRDLIREGHADRNLKLANALTDEIDSLLPEIRLAVEEDQLLVRVAKEGGVDLAALLVFFMFVD